MIFALRASDIFAVAKVILLLRNSDIAALPQLRYILNEHLFKAYL